MPKTKNELDRMRDLRQARRDELSQYLHKYCPGLDQGHIQRIFDYVGSISFAAMRYGEVQERDRLRRMLTGTQLLSKE